jgi:ferredoxin
MPSADGVHVLAAAVGAAEGDVRVDLVAGLAGYVALALLWLAVVWGIIQRVGWSFTSVKYASLQAVHRSFATLGLTVGLVHSGFQIARVNGTIKWYDLFLPFINEDDPIGTGLGIVGLELAVAVTISIAFQRALGYNRWRVLHLFSYVSFTLVSAHAVISGAAGTVVVFGNTQVINAVIIGGWTLTVLLGLLTAIRPQKPADAGIEVPEEVDPDAAVPVQVDPVKCARFGFCEHEAPDLFKLRADGMLTHQPKVGPERLDAAIEAARICPARAITLGKAPKVGPAAPPGLRTTGSIPALSGTGSLPVARTGAQLALPAGTSQPPPTGSQPAVVTGGQPPLATSGQPVLRTDGRPALRVVPTSPAVTPPPTPVPAGGPMSGQMPAQMQPQMQAPMATQRPMQPPTGVPLRQPEPVQPLRAQPPPPAQQPMTQPPMTQPPMTQPPMTQPPPAQPPMTQPPPAQPPMTQPPPVPTGNEPVTALPSSSYGFPAIANYEPRPVMPRREDPPAMPRREDPPAMPRREEPPRGTTYDTGSRNYGGKHHRDDD